MVNNKERDDTSAYMHASKIFTWCSGKEDYEVQENVLIYLSLSHKWIFMRMGSYRLCLFFFFIGVSETHGSQESNF